MSGTSRKINTFSSKGRSSRVAEFGPGGAILMGLW